MLPRVAGYAVERRPRHRVPARAAIRVLRQSSRSWAFWALVLTFWVCGWSTNSLIQTHFIPAAHDHGMAPDGRRPARPRRHLRRPRHRGLGWLTDRMDSRVLLAIYYGVPGLSLLAIDAVLAPNVEPGMWVFIVFYGLDWVATVPPTVALCRQHFGIKDSGMVFGWVFCAHMVGAGIGASIIRLDPHGVGQLSLGVAARRGTVLHLGGRPLGRKRPWSPPDRPVAGQAIQRAITHARLPAQAAISGHRGGRHRLIPDKTSGDRAQRVRRGEIRYADLEPHRGSGGQRTTAGRDRQ